MAASDGAQRCSAAPGDGPSGTPRSPCARCSVTAGCDTLLVTAPVDVRYLTGFTGSNGAVIVGTDADGDVLITDARYRERVRDVDIARVELTRRAETVVAELTDQAVGVDADHVTLAAAARLEAARGGRAVQVTAGLVAATSQREGLR
jgi:Xaa-Pro aminopeptidase